MNLRNLLTTLALSAPLLCAAQFGANSGEAKPPSVIPNYSMPAGKIYIDMNTLPKAKPNFAAPRTQITCTGTIAACKAANFNNVPDRATSTVNIGAFRTLCTLSHVAFDDPIVYPGQSGRTHLHQFFGNNSTRSASDLANMASNGNSTCAGGTLNRTGYWSPVMVYHCPAGSTNGCTLARDGEVHAANEANFYYKCDFAYDCGTGGYGGTAIQWPPLGLRMISGLATATTNAYYPHYNYICFTGSGPDLGNRGSQSGAGTTGDGKYDHIPTGAEIDAITGGLKCPGIQLGIEFPQCWNGVDLDVPDHISHMKFVDFNLGCNDPAFPILFPSIALNIHWFIVRADMPYMRLSSDPALSSGQPAGYTAHADWVGGWSTANINGWGKSITGAIIQECYSAGITPKRSSDCHDNLLGSPLGDNNWWTEF